MSRQAQSAIRLLGSLGYIYDGNNKWVASPQSLDDALAAAPSAPEQPKQEWLTDEVIQNLAHQYAMDDHNLIIYGDDSEVVPFARALLASQPSEVVPPGHADGHPDWETAYKGLLASQPATTTEYCWLVELFRGDGSGNSLGYYHTGFTDIDGGSRSTRNVHEAKRYTKGQAEQTAAKLGHALHGTWKAVEHGFETSQPAAPDYTEIMLAARKAHADAHGNSLNPQKMLHWESGFMDGVKARCGMPAAPVAAEQEPKYSFEMPKGWINLLNPGQSWAEWTKQKGVPTTKGWLISGKPSAASVEAATPAQKAWRVPSRYGSKVHVGEVMPTMPIGWDTSECGAWYAEPCAMPIAYKPAAAPTPAAVVGQDAVALKDYMPPDDHDALEAAAYNAHGDEPAQAVPSESVATPEFRVLISKLMASRDLHETSENCNSIISYINAWHAAGNSAETKWRDDTIVYLSTKLTIAEHEQAAQGQDEAVGAVCIFDSPDEIEWIGAVPPHGTKLYTRPQPPAQLSEPVGEVVDNVNGVWGVIYTDRKTPKAGTKLYIKE